MPCLRFLADIPCQWTTNTNDALDPLVVAADTEEVFA
jgi:hypothetical protein